MLRTKEAVTTFSGNVHCSIGAGLSAAVGIVGRAAEADLRAGDGGYAACYTYSCSKGRFFQQCNMPENLKILFAMLRFSCYVKFRKLH